MAEEAPKPKKEPPPKAESKTPDPPKKANKGLQIVGAIAATMGGLTLGTIIGWSSPAQDILIKDGITESQFTHISSIMCLGAATAQLYMFLTFDRVGRKWTMITVAIPIIIMWLLIAFLNNVILYLIARFVLGFCGGAFCVAAPTYIGEYSEKSIRGTLGVMFQLLLVIGIMFSYIMGLFSNRYILCFPMVIPPMVCIIMMACMPESPVLLLQKEKEERAEESLEFYRGRHFDTATEMDALEEYLDCDEGSFRRNMKKAATINGLLTLVAIHIYQRTCGISVLTFYADVLYQIGQVYGLEKEPFTIVCMSMQILATLTAMFLIERIGRRILWLISSGIIVITSTFIGTYFLVLAYHEDIGRQLEYVIVWIVWAYAIGYGLGVGPLPWCMLGEIPAPAVKRFVSSTAVAVHWIVAYLFIYLQKEIEYNAGEGVAFLVVGGTSLIGFLFIWFCILETKGLSLYEIQQSLKYQYIRSV